MNDKEAKKRTEGDAAVKAAIAAMAEPDRGMAERIDRLVHEHAPELIPRTWYGMPAYTREDKIICFFQSTARFKTRYATLGFQHDAHLDEGGMWPVSFALVHLGDSEAEQIARLIKKAVS